METWEDVVIVGGGIAGLATSLALKRVGIKSLVLERSEELRATGTALSLFPNAWRALDALGVAHKLTPHYPPVLKGHITDITTGATQQVSYAESQNRGEWEWRVVHRSALLATLAEELPPGTIHFSSKLSSIKMQHSVDDLSLTTIQLEDGTVINAKVVIGCDGVHSVVAQWLGLSAPVDSGRSAVRGLSVYPEGHGCKHEIQQFLGNGNRAGYVPLDDTQIYWFITHRSSPRDEEMISRDPQLLQMKVLEKYAKGFPSTFLDVVRKSELDSLTSAPLMFRLPWNLLFKQASKGNVTVAGDAMHPMTPDLGQGGCTALEDAVVLGRNISLFLHPTNDGKLVEWRGVTQGLESYVKERRWRVARVITGAYIMGKAQETGSSGWFMKFIRDKLFYKFVFPKIFGIMKFDVGKLPSVSSTS